MGGKVERGTPTTPLGKPQARPTGPLEQAPQQQAQQQPRPRQDAVAISSDAKQKIEEPGEAKRLWDTFVNNPVQDARQYWEDRSKEGGMTGFVGKAFGLVMDFSGVTSVAKNTSTALDGTKDTKTRAKAAAWALGEVAINFIPVGKIGGVGAKVFKVTGGAKLLKAVRNATKLGAEVKAGEKILHYTTAANAMKIADSAVLKGSERGFLSMGGKGGHWALTKEGLERRFLNNGQVYSMAADGKSTKIAGVVDAIVGVAPESKLGKVLGKVSPAKTQYDAVVEHVLTAEEAARSVRWGKTIVTNVPPGWKGIPLTTAEVGKIGKFGAADLAKSIPNQSVSLGPIDGMVGAIVNNKDMVAYAYLKMLAEAHKPK